MIDPIARTLRALIRPGCSLLLLASAAAARDAAPVSGPGFEDTFEKELAPGWVWLRETSDAWRLEDGGLEFRNRGDKKNVLVRDVPARAGRTIAIDVKVTSKSRPTEQYEQAGLFWYRDGKEILKFVKERIDGELYVFPGERPMPAATVELRIVLDGDDLTAYYRPEAKGEYLEAFTRKLPASGGKDQIGLSCFHGPEEAEHWVRFDDFRISVLPQKAAGERAPRDSITVPLIDLDDHAERQVVVDKEAGQYLGHPTTCLLEDGKTMLCVYPKGHGRGAIVYKRSVDGGLSWSDRLPTPENWSTSQEVPTLHRVVGPDGTRRVIVWSGLYPARLAVSEDDGATWSELKPVGDWGGIVVMGSVVELRSGKGRYLAMFHDDGRFFAEGGKRADPVVFTLYKTSSSDGGLTWSFPEPILSRSDVHLCEPGVVRSPDGKQLACLLRENSRRKNSHIVFSDDEGKTWTDPRELPASLSGDRHTGRYGPDGRLFISFRDRPAAHVDTATEGDWVGWVGTYGDLVAGTEGQYRVRLKDNTKGADCAYPGVEVLPDGTFVVTTYGHWEEGEAPYILSVRFRLEELDALAKKE